MNRTSRLFVVAAATTLLFSACVPVAFVGGVTAGSMTVADRRPLSQQGTDAELDNRAARRVRENFGDRVHLNTMAYNQALLITGEVPTQEVMAEVETLLKLTPNLKRLINEIRIAELSSSMERANDALITTAVKTRFGQAGAFNLAHVKVATEANRVFLMGKVTQKEADAAIEIARNTSAVSRVVNVFEIASDEEIRRLDASGAPSPQTQGPGNTSAQAR